MNLHWHVIITQSPQFTFRFTVDVCSMGLDKYVVTCIHHYSATQRIFTAPKILCALHSSIPPALWQPLVLLLSPWFCLFQNATVEIIQYVSMRRVFTLSMESLHNNHKLIKLYPLSITAWCSYFCLANLKVVSMQWFNPPQIHTMNSQLASFPHSTLFSLSWSTSSVSQSTQFLLQNEWLEARNHF